MGNWKALLFLKQNSVAALSFAKKWLIQYILFHKLLAAVTSKKN